MIAEVGTALKIYELAEKQGWVSRLRTALRKKHRVLVLGSTGVGKTNLLTSLHKVLPEAIGRLNRTQYASKRALKIRSEPFVFVDTPGELGKKSRRIRAIREAIAQGPVGVINVVAYGYHEYRTGKEEALEPTGEAKAKWLSDHLKVELSALEEWNTLLGARENANWLVTICTKADLWWHQRQVVFDYYETGDYAKSLGSAAVLDPTVVSHCSIIKRFYDEGLVSSQFDEPLRAELRTSLLATLLEAIGKGAEDGR